jgi:Thioredoxin
MGVTHERFAQGMSFDEYRAQMQQNQEKFADNYNGAELDSAAVQFVCNLDVPLNVMIITEDWCGDALTYVPVFGRLAECSDCWTLKVFLRDQNLDLADQYLKEGKHRSVPVFVFFDEDMHEVGCFIERPGAVNAERQHLIDTWAEHHPDVITPGRPYAEQSPEGQALLAEPLRELRLGRLRRWQQACVDEIVQILRPLEREPAGVGR